MYISLFKLAIFFYHVENFIIQLWNLNKIYSTKNSMQHKKWVTMSCNYLICRCATQSEYYLCKGLGGKCAYKGITCCVHIHILQIETNIHKNICNYRRIITYLERVVNVSLELKVLLEVNLMSHISKRWKQQHDKKNSKWSLGVPMCSLFQLRRHGANTECSRRKTHILQLSCQRPCFFISIHPFFVVIFHILLQALWDVSIDQCWSISGF
jgi:hypothetical protein